MIYRNFGRLGWKVSEIGYGMWGLGGQWKGSTDDEALESLAKSIELGCNFFDTAWAYNEGHSERLFAKINKNVGDKKLYVASKIPPKNGKWPATGNLEEAFPYDHIIEYTKKSLENLGVEKIDLMQFHVWDDSWKDNDEWKRAIEDLKSEGIVDGFGISINRWEPENVINTLETNLIDAVQVIYNIFDQAPEDKLLPVCKEKNIAVIARVPFDEGTLTGTLTKETKFDPSDWRATYFVEENLNASVDRAEKLKKILPLHMTMAELALRFILENNTVSTIIPGMRRIKNVESNTAVSDGQKLDSNLMNLLRKHRWDRKPTKWSQ